MLRFAEAWFSELNLLLFKPRHSNLEVKVCDWIKSKNVHHKDSETVQEQEAVKDYNMRICDGLSLPLSKNSL